MRRSIRWIAVAGVGLLMSCSSGGPAPELGEIYNPAAEQSHVDRNPIIVIPGVLGSRLISGSNGQVVWGEFGPGAIDFSSADGMRELALPVSASGWPRDDVRVDGVLEELKVSLGFNFRFKAYSQMMQAFGAGGYRDPAAVKIESVDYGEDHFTCFQFAYDWRRSCAENAALLGKFMEEKKRYVASERKRRYGTSKPVKFDVIAHSMGGLVARYYLMYGGRSLAKEGRMPVSWAGARNIEKLVVVGSPNGGSVYAYNELHDGLKLAPILPRIQAGVIGTMPSAYELLPPLADGALIDEHSVPINYYDSREWERREWGLMDPRQDKVLAALTGKSSGEQRKNLARQHLQKLLDNAQAFHRAMDCDCKPPAGVELHAFVGDAEPTGSRIQVSSRGKLEIIDWVAGDGTVARRSVLRDKRKPGDAGRMRSPIPWTGTHFVFSNHVKMTADPAFVDNVLHILLERP